MFCARRIQLRRLMMAERADLGIFLRDTFPLQFEIVYGDVGKNMNSTHIGVLDIAF